LAAIYLLYETIRTDNLSFCITKNGTFYYHVIIFAKGYFAIPQKTVQWTPPVDHF